MEFLTTTEVAKVLDVSVNTVKKYIKDGLLTAYRPAGTRYKIPKESVAEFLEKSMVQTVDQAEKNNVE